jgi:hypothetical protein
VVQQLAAAQLRGERLGREVALVDAPARAVIQHPLLDFFVDLHVQARGVDHHELRSHSARFCEEAFALARLEVTVEVSGKDPVERAVIERERQCVPLHDGHVSARELQHPWALVESNDVPAQMPRQEAGAAGDVERSGRRQRGENVHESRELLRPARPLSIREESDAQVPLVVLGRPRVVVRLHGS